MLKQKLLIPALVLTLVGVTGVTVSKASAQSEVGGMHDTLVQKLVDKFGLKKDEVQAVFDEAHTERHKKMEARFEEKLTKLVTDGKLTEAQKQALLQKHKEMEANREVKKEEFKDMTPEERKAAMEKAHTEFQAWATEQGIDLDTVMPFGEGMGRGGKMFRHMTH